MRLVGFFFKSPVPKQTQKYQPDFKAFAEQGVQLNTAARQTN